MAQLPQKLYGSGADGAKTVSGTETLNAYYSCTGSAASSAIAVASGDDTNFAAGDLVLLHKSRGATTTAAGTWELVTVSSTADTVVNFTSNLVNSYQDSGADQSQAVLVPQYTTFSCPSGQVLAATSWNESVGGIITICAKESIEVAGTVRLNGATGTGSGADATSGGATGGGFYGGDGASVINDYWSKNGEGDAGVGGGDGPGPNGNGGGGAQIVDNNQAAGGGGGNGATGTTGTKQGSAVAGIGGTTGGNAELTVMVFGGGGGGGVKNTDSEAGGGGSGAGIIFLISKNVTFTGAVNTNGGAGANKEDADGGGGAGGSVLIKGETVDIGTNKITASAGAGGSDKGGAGGVGRIRVEYGLTLTGSTASPAASTEKVAALVEFSAQDDTQGYFLL